MASATLYIDRTTSSFIDGNIGKLLYRGYNIDDLAENASFEETIYLLLYGKLPNRAELDEFDAVLKANRRLPDEIIDIIKLTKNAHPMDVLRTAISALATFDPEVDDNSAGATLRKGVRLTAQAPTIVAAHARIREGKDPVTPNESLSHAGNFLYMLSGDQPDPEDVRLIDKTSCYTRNMASMPPRSAPGLPPPPGRPSLRGRDRRVCPQGAFTRRRGRRSDEDGSGHRQRRECRELRAGHVEQARKGDGFGHRVYKAMDPRANHLRPDAKALGERKGQPKWFSILQTVSEVMEPYARRGICENVDFWSGSIYYLLDIPDDLFISIFTMGRIPGWTSQVIEQFENNILLRPRLQYIGPMDLEYTPIDERE